MLVLLLLSVMQIIADNFLGKFRLVAAAASADKAGFEVCIDAAQFKEEALGEKNDCSGSEANCLLT